MIGIAAARRFAHHWQEWRRQSPCQTCHRQQSWQESSPMATSSSAVDDSGEVNRMATKGS